MNRSIRALLVTAASLIVVVTVLRAAVFWRNEAYLDDASGNWTALAKDAAEGVFYRPLHGPDGYGGSRYFPLHFVTHAALMKAGAAPIASGFVMSVCSMGLLVSGVYVLLVRLGASRVMAGASAAFVLAAHPSQEALLAIKGDALAAALSTWGVAFSLAATPAALGAAALLFTLAFAAKLTMISGLAASAVFLWCTGRWRRGVGLLAASAAGMIVVLLIMYVASRGVVFDVLRGSASGGTTIRDVLLAPMTLARQARRVPETLVFIQLGFAAMAVLILSRRTLRDLPILWFLAILAVTTFIFGSPGTDTNHFIDLHVASLVLVGYWLAGADPARLDFGAAAVGVAALAASLSLGSGIVNARSEARRGLVADALKLIPDRSRPILAQNPLVPVVAGQRAYMLDPFLIRVLSERDPSFGEPLWADLQNRRFSAVVFESDPESERARSMYRSALLGPRFLEEVERNYEPAGRVGQRVVYLPRNR